MLRAFAVLAAFLFMYGAAAAQSPPSTSGMGTTSPLGVPGTSGASGTGIPLGATEIDPGGLSPMPGSNCSPAAGSSGTFDGGGLTTGSGTGCAPGSSQASSAGAASPQSGNTSPTLIGGGIPLGATETGTSGLSPLIATPAPTVSTPGVGTPLSSTTGSMSAPATSPSSMLIGPCGGAAGVDITSTGC